MSHLTISIIRFNEKGHTTSFVENDSDFKYLVLEEDSLLNFWSVSKKSYTTAYRIN